MHVFECLKYLPAVDKNIGTQFMIYYLMRLGCWYLSNVLHKSGIKVQMSLKFCIKYKFKCR